MVGGFLLSGLFLGWSLGANDAANIFGTGVGTRMVRFRTAALVASLGVTAGAVAGGSGTTDTLGSLGAVNAVGGSFTVALMAGVCVAWMNRAGIPVSTSQAVVGAIVGWNVFAGSPTDGRVLATIVAAWAASPAVAAAVAILLYWLTRWWLRRFPLHLLRLDALTRAGLIVVGAFGAYSLGANNIGNVIGMFVPAVSLDSVPLGPIDISGVQQLCLLGVARVVARQAPGGSWAQRPSPFTPASDSPAGHGPPAVLRSPRPGTFPLFPTHKVGDSPTGVPDRSHFHASFRHAPCSARARPDDGIVVRPASGAEAACPKTDSTRLRPGSTPSMPDSTSSTRGSRPSTKGSLTSMPG